MRNQNQQPDSVVDTFDNAISEAVMFDIPPPEDPQERSEWKSATAIRHATELSAVVGQDYLLDAEPATPGTVLRYLDMNTIGAWFGVAGATVSLWRTRYAATHPFPSPDAVTGRTPGWAPGREAEIRRWEAGRPGRGRRRQD
ncbi:hypothetical protein [Amycolatopsis sp. NPDC059657]|uniref:hypothetical protein n=1 Tax=Amycolatopsis sp. NPDC059657 TaxID=3346899 RepID=UPI00366AD74E